MGRHLIVVLTLLLFAAAPAPLEPTAAARGCNGGACSACKNCTGCKHCAKQGGTCSVCRPGTASPPRTPGNSFGQRSDGQAERDRQRAEERRQAEEQRKREEAEKRERDRRMKEFIEQRQAEMRAAEKSATEDGVAVLFSPHGGCTAAIVKEINGAAESVDVLAYRLTSKPIAAALSNAHERGVTVTIVVDVDGAQAGYSDARYFDNAGITTLVDTAHKIQHNKVIIVDDATVITGSFNFSEAAEKDNAENLLVIKGKPAIAAAYKADFLEHVEHATPYEFREKR